MCPEVVCPENKQEAKTKSLAILAVGSMVATAYHVRNAIEKETGYGPELINMRFDEVSFGVPRFCTICQKADASGRYTAICTCVL